MVFLVCKSMQFLSGKAESTVEVMIICFATIPGFERWHVYVFSFKNNGH